MEPLRASSYFDVLIYPFLRDADVILLAVVGYFLVQYTTMFLMPLWSREFRQLNIADQRNFAVRVVAVVNGLIMFNSAYIFVSELQRNGWKLHNRHYDEIPGYRPYRLIIVGYFLWDIIVCIGYRWGAMWTVHAISSFLGTYFLAYPFSDQYAAYYSGMFETSNAFIHVAALLKMLHTHANLARWLEYVFAVMFFLIRVVGGTIVTSRWYLDMVPILWAGKGHSALTIVCCLLLVAIVMVLQYIWFWEIVKLATGIGAASTSSSAAGDKPKRGSGSSTPTSPAGEGSAKNATSGTSFTDKAAAGSRHRGVDDATDVVRDSGRSPRKVLRRAATKEE